MDNGEMLSRFATQTAEADAKRNCNRPFASIALNETKLNMVFIFYNMSASGLANRLRILSLAR